MQKSPKHNKKRNTAFLYESLIREMTRAVLGKDLNKKEVVVDIIKTAFGTGTGLREELECYRSLLESFQLNSRGAEKLIFFVKEKHSQIDKKQLFNEQTRLINLVNKQLQKGVFANFVPNYKDLANVYQIFNNQGAPHRKVLLEERLHSRLTATRKQPTQNLLQPVDNLVYKTFVRKFNEKYSGTLLQEQELLLNKFILSFADNGLDFKVFVNEEVGRLKQTLRGALRSEEILTDVDLTDKTRQVIDLLESFKDKEITSEIVKKLLTVQNLVSEIKADA